MVVKNTKSLLLQSISTETSIQWRCAKWVIVPDWWMTINGLIFDFITQAMLFYCVILYFFDAIHGGNALVCNFYSNKVKFNSNKGGSWFLHLIRGTTDIPRKITFSYAISVCLWYCSLFYHIVVYSCSQSQYLLRWFTHLLLDFCVMLQT